VNIVEKVPTNGGEFTRTLDIPVLNMETIVPLDNIENIILILSTEGKESLKISSCYIRTFEDPTTKLKEKLILGRKYLYYVNKEQNEIPTTDKGICHHEGDIYWFNENPDFKKNINSGAPWAEKQDTYTHNIEDTIQQREDSKTDIEKKIKEGYILQIRDDIGSAFSLQKQPRVFTGDKSGLVTGGN
jgi:hypothetical protein